MTWQDGMGWDGRVCVESASRYTLYAMLPFCVKIRYKSWSGLSELDQAFLTTVHLDLSASHDLQLQMDRQQGWHSL